MAYVLNLPTFLDHRGSLTVAENILPFEIKRFYYIYNAIGIRGGHRHKRTIQALISLGGSCHVYVHNGEREEVFVLDSSDKCLILDPHDWHSMDNFSENSTLLVLASELYDANDYIKDNY